MDGHRPELRKSWPERLRALLASAWHTDFSKRPTAADIVSILEDIKASLPEREQRRPSTTAPSFGNAPHSRCDTRSQRSVSAPSSMSQARRPSAHGGGGGGGSDVPPAASPARKRFSFPLTRASPAVKRRWSFVTKASIPRRASGTSRARKESATTMTESKTKPTLPLPLAHSFSSTTSVANTVEDDKGTGIAADDCPRPHFDRTSHPCCCHHQEGTNKREIIAESLAREAESTQQEALARESSANQEAATRAVRYLSLTAGIPGTVADRERSYAERQERGVDATGLRVGAGGEGGKGEEDGGGGAGSRSTGEDDIVDVASNPFQTATEEVPARVRRDSSLETAAQEAPAHVVRYSSSQDKSDDAPAGVRRHSNSQENGEPPAGVRRHSSLQATPGEVAARVSRHTSLEATAGEISARGSPHTSIKASAGEATVRVARGSSLSKLWPSKSNWSNNPEDSSSLPWAWRNSHNGSVDSYAATTFLPGDENVGHDMGSNNHPAAMSGEAAAGRPFAPFAPTGERDLHKRERPVKSSRNPRAYALETNAFNPLQRAPL